MKSFGVPRDSAMSTTEQIDTVMCAGRHTSMSDKMPLAMAPGPTAHWLFRSHDLPSKFTAIASRICGRRNRAVEHMHVSPLLRNFVGVSAVLLVPNFIL